MSGQPPWGGFVAGLPAEEPEPPADSPSTPPEPPRMPDVHGGPRAPATDDDSARLARILRTYFPQLR